MTANTLIHRARSAGVTIVPTPTGNLTLEGPPDAVAVLMREVRANKADLLKILSAPAADTAPRRLWVVTHPDGSPRSHSFCPAATLAEVRSWYPTAASIEPEHAPELAPKVEPPAALPARPDTETAE